jgi:biopolymer transport protein ExbB
MTGIWKILDEGGIMMIPLLVTSVVGLAVFIERALFLRRRRILRKDILSLILSIEDPGEVEKALNEMKKNAGPFINIIRVGLENRSRPKEEVREAIQDQGRQEAGKLGKGLIILETIAGIAPLMGLLGTVLGMIKVFGVISEQGLGQTQALSAGISEALNTTVVGLSIAIPALVAFNYFNHKVEDIVLEIEKYSSRLLQKLDPNHYKKKGKA